MPVQRGKYVAKTLDRLPNWFASLVPTKMSRVLNFSFQKPPYSTPATLPITQLFLWFPSLLDFVPTRLVFQVPNIASCRRRGRIAAKIFLVVRRRQ